MVVLNVRGRDAYRRVIRVRLDKCHGRERRLQETLAPIQHSRIQSHKFGSNNLRGELVVASNGVQDGAGFAGWLEPGSDNPDRTRHPCLKAVGVDPEPRWDSGYTGLSVKSKYTAAAEYIM
jgi:hypothetical protein